MKNYITAMITIITLAFSQNTQYNDYKENLQKYFEVTNTIDLLDFSINQTFDMLIDADAYGISDISKSTLDEIIDEFKTELRRDFVDLSLPIYMKYLSNNDLKNIIKFYRTSSGRKLAKNTTTMTQEMSVVFEQWGEKMGKEIAQKIMRRFSN